MKLMLDGRPLQGGTGHRGVGHYVRALASGLLRAAPELELTLLVDPRAGPAESWPEGAIESAATAPPGPQLLWGRLMGPSWIARTAADLWHATFLAPPRVPRGLGWVATIHDLIPLDHPRSFSWRQRLVFRGSLRLAARAPRVVAVSRHTADRIVDRLGADRRRVVVVPPPVETAHLASGPGGVTGVAGPYLLHLGGFDPLKGVHDQLLPAFSRVARGKTDLHLVLTGGESRWRSAARRAAETLGVASRVIFAGVLDGPAIASALRGAAAVVVSSREEGFGIPAVEALAAGVPVACSMAPTVREILDGVGCLAREPGAAALAAAISAALEEGNDEVRVRARRERAARYGADAVARRMLDVYREVLGR